MALPEAIADGDLAGAAAAAPTDPVVAPQPEFGPGEPGPTADALRRAESKPPLYRFFRGGMYVIYMAITLFLGLAVVVAAWSMVWGAPGQALKQEGRAARPLTATPHTAPTP